MAEVPLRSYLHEIEKDIESGRTDQAIAHSRHILQTYPKYVDAYRLLGKSYLESQRYTDAGDIFQRVLSSIPDDFVAHVGMSIIREDEGNIDEAIWHMERAFEVQPSNNAIQGELRRLFGRRDKVEPPKIRLTRGALARLYYKGELYLQAISEIRAALSEAPTRLDLQALLADIYFKTGQPADATETALNVLKHLPNCLVANRVMIQVLKGTDRTADLQTYQQRVAQLDPYSAFITQNYPDSESVPDQAAQIEKLDWKPDQSMTAISQPDWAASLGVNIGEMAPTSEQPLPDWLENMSFESDEHDTAPAADAFGAEIQAADQDLSLSAQMSSIEDGTVPDWLRDAGWQTSEEGENPPEPEPDFGDAAKIVKSEAEIASAEIPDWLLAMAPPEEIEADRSAEENLAPWLDKILPTDQTLTGEIPEEVASETSTPDWLIEASLAGAGAALAADQPAEEPAFVDEEPAEDLLAEADLFANESGSPEIEPAEAEPIEAAPAESMPDWLLEIKQASLEEAPLESESEDQPELEAASDSISDVDVVAKTDLEEEWEAVGPAAAALPSWLQDESDSEPLAGTGIAKHDLYETEAGLDLPDWLKTIEPEAMAPLDSSSDTDIPAWLLETETATLETQPEPAIEPSPQAEMLDTAQETETMPDQAVADEALLADIPDWLLEVGQEQPVEEQFAEADSLPAETADEVPDWLQATVAATSAAALVETISDEEETVEAEPIQETVAPAEQDFELPDWLMEQPVEESAGTQEEDEIEIPDWLKAPADAEASVTEEILPEMSAFETKSSEPVEAEIEPTAELPDWLQDMQAPPLEDTRPTHLEQEQALTVEEPQPAAEPDSLQEAFAWLMGLGTGAAILDSDQESTPPATPTEEKFEEELVEFQEEMIPAVQVPGITEESFTTTPTPEAALPPLEPEHPVEQITPELSAATQPDQFSKEALGLDEGMLDQDAAFAWLESLAVKQGASEALLLTPEERSETMPEWVKNDIEAAQAAQSVEAEADLGETPPEETRVEEETPELVPPAATALEMETTEATSSEIEAEPVGEWQEAAAEAEQEVELFIPADEIEKPGGWEITAEEETLISETLVQEPAEPGEWIEAAKEAEALVAADASGVEQEIPPLPDWLTESAISPHEEMDWTPPPVPQRRYDLNEASLSELERLPGLGFITAQKITDYRDLHGPFESIEGLLLVPDFTEPMLESVRDFLFVKPAAPVAPITPPAYEEPLLLAETEEISAELASARTDLTQNHLQRALDQYAQLIHANIELKQIAQDLQEAAYRYPDNFDIWQNLGDAQLRLNNIQEALEAYIKAEQLLA